MKNTNWVFALLLIVGISPIGSGLHYFIGGEAYQNSNLRNYAVVGQIIFGLAIVGYSFWHLAASPEKGKR